MIKKEECDLIVEHNRSFNCKEEIINGVNTFQYNYFLASYVDFWNPFNQMENKIDTDITAYELRGITFVENKKGVFERTLFLNKFFNINQVEETMLYKVKDKKIKRIAIKEDGSAITFVNVGGEVLGKTKFAFQSDQAVLATQIYNQDEHIKKFVDWCLENDYSPLFEYVSSKFKIVLVYKEIGLKLLQLRDNNTGEFIDIYNLDLSAFNLDIADEVPYLNDNGHSITIEEIIEDFQTREGIEGYVITFEDGQMIKIKTVWYMERHHLLTEDISKENFVIRHIVEETIDDILAQVPVERTDDRKAIDDITEVIVNHVNDEAENILLIVKFFDGDRKKFYVDNKEYSYQKILMLSLSQKLNKEEIEEKLKKEILKKAFGYNQAIDFLKDLGYSKHE